MIFVYSVAASYLYLAHLIHSATFDLNCGNGRVDPGEECDPLAPGLSSECCTAYCRYAPVSQACFGGTGVCQLGKCITRSSQCATLDTTTIQFSSPQNGVTGMTGPWETCVIPVSRYVPGGQQPPKLSDIMGTGEVAGVSVVDQLLPSHLSAQVPCSKVCEGNAVGNATFQRICADLAAFANYNALSADYLSCAVDNTAKVNFKEFRDKSANERDYNAILNPGICISGVCRPDICGATRCSNRGSCVLSQSSVESINSALTLESSSTPSSDISLVSCICDRGWKGNQCDIPVSGFNSTVRNSTDSDVPTIVDFCSSLTQQRVQEIVITSVMSTAAGCLILFLLLAICARLCMKRAKGKDEDVDMDPESYSAYHGQKSAADKNKRVSVLSNIVLVRDGKVVKSEDNDNPTTPIRELEELPEIQHYDTIDLGNADGVLLDRKSSQSDKTVISPAEEGEEQNEDDNVNTVTESEKELKSTFATTTVAATSTAIQVETIKNDDKEIQSADNKFEFSLNPVSERPQSGKQNVLLPPNYLRAAYAYNARLADEINLLAGDILYLIKVYDDGWAKAYNLRSGREGIFPLSFTKRIVVKDASESLKSFAKGGVYAGTGQSGTGESSEGNNSSTNIDISGDGSPVISNSPPPTPNTF